MQYKTTIRLLHFPIVFCLLMLCEADAQTFKRKSWDVSVNRQFSLQNFNPTIIYDFVNLDAYKDSLNQAEALGAIPKELDEKKSGPSVSIHVAHSFRHNFKRSLIKHLDATIGVTYTVWRRTAIFMKNSLSAPDYKNLDVEVYSTKKSIGFAMSLDAVSKSLFKRLKLTMGVRNTISPVNFSYYDGRITYEQNINNNYSYKRVNTHLSNGVRSNEGFWNYASLNAGLVYNIDCKYNFSIKFHHGQMYYRGGTGSLFSGKMNTIELGAQFLLTDENSNMGSNSVFW